MVGVQGHLSCFGTGSIRGHNHLMDVVVSLSRDSKIGPVRVNHKVSTTGEQGDVEISNFPISLRDGLVLDVSFGDTSTGKGSTKIWGKLAKVLRSKVWSRWKVGSFYP